MMVSLRYSLWQRGRAKIQGQHFYCLPMTTPEFTHLVFDVESIADGDLIAKVRYPGETLTPEEAVDRYRNELLEKWGSEFIPYTFHVPISVTIGKISPSFELYEIKSLDEPDYEPHEIVRKFWKGWKHFKQPTLVSFNGRTFDIPLLELSAFRFGLDISEWLGEKKISYEKPRNRYNQQAHLDLQEVLTNFSATRFNGGLNLAAMILGKPGKMGIAGHMVQDLYDNGELKSINDYCRCDVLDTYFVFLRYKVMSGELTLEREQEIVAKTLAWLKENAEETPVYNEYLDGCTEWVNPWLVKEAT